MSTASDGTTMTTTTTGTDLDGRHDFDFLFGSWRVDNRRLVSRLTGSREWEQFVAMQTCRPFLGGIGNVEEFRPEAGDWAGYEGAALRIYDPKRDEWTIHWADNVTCGLLPPVVGRFVSGTGEFTGNETLGGRPVLVRFRWDGITPTTAHWEQAFSSDGGQTWETNWHMDFTRLS